MAETKSKSDPEIRRRIIEALRKSKKRVLIENSMVALKTTLELDDVPNRKVDQALRSLTYKADYRPLGVRFTRPRRSDTDLRSYCVSYAGA